MGKKRFFDENGNEVNAREKKPLYKKWWVWLIAIIIIGGAIGGGGDAAEENDQTNSVEATEDSNNEDSGSSSMGGEEKNEMEEVEVNKVIEFGADGESNDLLLKINEVGDTSEIVENDYLSYSPDNGKYALINVTLKNNSNESLSLHNGMFKLILDGTEFSGETLIGLDNKYITFENINPGIEVNGNLVFNVADDVEVTEAVLQFSGNGFFSDPLDFKLK